MNKTFHKSRGQIAVIYAGIVAALLAAVGLGTDVTIMYINWQQLQKAADAAVLAGGGGLPDNTAGATIAVNTYLTSNGIVGTDVVTGPTFSPDHTQISVTVKRTVPYYFGRALGLVNSDVQVTATAQAQTGLSPNGDVFPVGLDLIEFPTLSFDGSRTYSIYNGTNKAPGSKGVIDITNGAGDPYLYMGPTAFPGTLTVGEALPTVTGCKNGQAKGPLAARLAAGAAADAAAGISSPTWNDHAVGSPQEIVLPVGTWSGVGSGAQFTISQFVKAWITPDSTGCNTSVYLMPGAAGGKGTTGTPCLAGNGICVVALIK